MLVCYKHYELTGITKSVWLTIHLSLDLNFLHDAVPVHHQSIVIYRSLSCRINSNWFVFWLMRWCLPKSLFGTSIRTPRTIMHLLHCLVLILHTAKDQLLHWIMVTTQPWDFCEQSCLKIAYTCKIRRQEVILDIVCVLVANNALRLKRTSNQQLTSVRKWALLAPNSSGQVTAFLGRANALEDIIVTY